MTLAYWCVLIAGMMPIATVVIAKFHRGYDNADPRAWLDKQQGMRRRADYAHRNHFETFLRLNFTLVHAPRRRTRFFATVP
jgi:uncharacterized MAPEG superfamily protein